MGAAEADMVELKIADLLSIISMIIGSGVIAWLFRLVGKLAAMEANLEAARRDLNIIMSFLFNRAKTELVSAGLAEIHSPIVLNVSCAEAVMPFLGKFIPFYIQVLKKYPTAAGEDLEKVLFKEFEYAFGDFIVEHICIPMNVNQGACLLAIIKACQQMHTIQPKPLFPWADQADLDSIRDRVPHLGDKIYEGERDRDNEKDKK